MFLLLCQEAVPCVWTGCCTCLEDTIQEAIQIRLVCVRMVSGNCSFSDHLFLRLAQFIPAQVQKRVLDCGMFFAATYYLINKML